MINACVLADSRPDGNYHRLTTLEVTFPRFILAEFNTHRVFSRNSASSRAIPTARQLELIENHPFYPKAFSINKPGMSADEYIYPDNPLYDVLVASWLRARDAAVTEAKFLFSHNVHKQHANRILEPYMWHTVIVSSTEWQNFWKLRISEHAQPEINEAATLMKAAYDASIPRFLKIDEWHTPLVKDTEVFKHEGDAIIASVARVAAVSYNRHDKRDLNKERERYTVLSTNGHLSPFEHVARMSNNSAHWANFKGWQQARWFVEHGEDPRLAKA